MPERPKAGPPFSDWGAKPISVLDIKPDTKLTHEEANLLCSSCIFHSSLGQNFNCEGFQHGNTSNRLKSATITSSIPQEKEAWIQILGDSACNPTT